jgi:hypothetical protein
LIRASRRLQPVGVALAVAEPERILAHLRLRQDRVARIEEDIEARLRADPAMMVAAWADPVILLIFLGEDHRVAVAAFVPQILRRLALGQERDALADSVQPAHAACLLWRGG